MSIISFHLGVDEGVIQPTVKWLVHAITGKSMEMESAPFLIPSFPLLN